MEGLVLALRPPASHWIVKERGQGVSDFLAVAALPVDGLLVG